MDRHPLTREIIMRKTITALAMTAGLAASLNTHAYVLQGRDLDGNPANGYEAVYDPEQALTWLADANYAKTSGYDADGRMDWATANAWAAGLNYYGYTGWRLPATPQPDPSCAAQLNPGGFPPQGYGFNCTGSEMGHLFYLALGGKAGEGVYNQGGDTAEERANLALFGSTI